MRLHDLDRSGSSRTNDAVPAVRMFRAGVGGPYEVAAGRVGFRLDGWDYWMTPAASEDFDRVSLEHPEVRGWPLMYLIDDVWIWVWPKPAVDMQMIVEAGHENAPVRGRFTEAVDSGGTADLASSGPAGVVAPR